MMLHNDDSPSARMMKSKLLDRRCRILRSVMKSVQSLFHPHLSVNAQHDLTTHPLANASCAPLSLFLSPLLPTSNLKQQAFLLLGQSTATKMEDSRNSTQMPQNFNKRLVWRTQEIDRISNCTTDPYCKRLVEWSYYGFKQRGKERCNCGVLKCQQPYILVNNNASPSLFCYWR